MTRNDHGTEAPEPGMTTAQLADLRTGLLQAMQEAQDWTNQYVDDHRAAVAEMRPPADVEELRGKVDRYRGQAEGCTSALTILESVLRGNRR